MTIPKNAGLSHLADVANPIEHYPVKRRGQRRRLDPNWDAIRWLESESDFDCKIARQTPADEDGLTYTRAYGRIERDYNRPMFQVIPVFGSESWHNTNWVTPCQCDRLERTWNCETHFELEWDTERRCWVRPGTPVWYEKHPEDRPPDPPAPQPTAYHSPEPPDGGTLQGIYARMVEMLDREQPQAPALRTPSPFNPAEYTWNPPGGLVEGRPVGYGGIAADELLAAEWERQNAISLADAVRAMGSGVNPFAPDARRRLDALPDASLTLTGTFTLEITGDTTQAPASTVRIEVRRNDPTA